MLEVLVIIVCGLLCVIVLVGVIYGDGGIHHVDLDND